MRPPIFDILKDAPAVTALIGSPTPPSIMRCFPFGEAPQNVALPYLTYALVTGNPQNTLADRPTTDGMGTQVDLLGRTEKECVGLFNAVQAALELRGYISNVGTAERDPGTKLYHLRFDFDSFEDR